MFNQDGGYAEWQGDKVYWDKDDVFGNVINIFPGGMPPRSHYTHEHDHIKVQGATVSTFANLTTIVGGRVVWQRIDGAEKSFY